MAEPCLPLPRPVRHRRALRRPERLPDGHRVVPPPALPRRGVRRRAHHGRARRLARGRRRRRAQQPAQAHAVARGRGLGLGLLSNGLQQPCPSSCPLRETSLRGPRSSTQTSRPATSTTSTTSSRPPSTPSNSLSQRLASTIPRPIQTGHAPVTMTPPSCPSLSLSSSFLSLTYVISSHNHTRIPSLCPSPTTSIDNRVCARVRARRPPAVSFVPAASTHRRR